MKLNSHNEWDELKEVVVGTASDSMAPLVIQPRRPIGGAECERIAEIAREAFPQSLIDEVNEDIEGLCELLTKRNVKVYRPGGYNPTVFFETPFFAASSDNLYNVRDLNIIIGNTIVECASPGRHRIFESYGLYDIFYHYLKEGCRWICAPKPKLDKPYETIRKDDNEKYDIIQLAEDEILFDAANIVRMGKDLLYLVSKSGNYLGAKWLQNVLGDDYKIHTTEGIVSWSHIDTTVVCLRPGLVLFNGEQVNENNYPRIFEKWERIYFNDVKDYPAATVEFHNNVRKAAANKLREYGVQTNIKTMSSRWIGINLLSIDDKTVLVDERQTSLMHSLKKYNIESIPVKMRHSYVMKGGLHCCTLDTVRDGRLEQYF